MSEPDELYTLRAQYWLGHYGLATQEAKSLARRPLTVALKVEREEFLARTLIALGQYDKVTVTDTPALQSWALKAQFEAAIGDEGRRSRIVDQLKALAQGEDANSTAQLAAAQVLLQENQVAAAYQCVANSSMSSGGMEHVALKLQILLKIDRLDLAKELIQQLRTVDEDSIITQLCSVYVHLAEGRSGAADAEHTLNMLSEQYGPSTFLLNLTACALISAGNYAGAETKLQECLNDHLDTGCADTLVNLITVYIHQNKVQQAYQTVQELKMNYPNHPFHAGLERVTSAFDREAIKYKV